MPNQKQPVWVNAIAFIGLAASMTVVIHSLVTGQGIHTFSLLLSIFLVMVILRDRKGRTWKGISVIAFAGMVVALGLVLQGAVAGQGIDAIALGGGIFLAVLGLLHVFLIRSGYDG